MTEKRTEGPTASHFNRKWWTCDEVLNDRLNIVKDLLKMLDGERLDLNTSPALINRAFLTCDFINKEVNKGAKILEMACGLGFVTHVLIEKGYSVDAFDISEEAISIAKEEAVNLSQNPDNFSVADENYLSNLEDSSVDVVVGLGYLRYLNGSAQDYLYKNVRRILKPAGVFIIDHQNDLYEMFALNDESIKFWADFISSYCDIEKLFKGNELLVTLNQNITTPVRKRKGHSFSKKMDVFSENPLTYGEKAESYGFFVSDLLYPHSDIIPPFLQNQIKKMDLELIQRENCLTLARNWKSMFMCYQFLTFLKKSS